MSRHPFSVFHLFLPGLLGAVAGAAVFLLSRRLGAGLILSLVLGGVSALGLTAVLVLRQLAGGRGEANPGRS